MAGLKEDGDCLSYDESGVPLDTVIGNLLLATNQSLQTRKFVSVCVCVCLLLCHAKPVEWI